MTKKNKTDYSKQEWYVDINKVRTDYVRIKDLSAFMGDPVPMVHPADPYYGRFWLNEVKRCIEGVWSKQFEGYRFMPGNLYFFGKYGVIQHTENKATKFIRPYIVDFIWDYAYDSIVCRGFSGFKNDREYTCELAVKEYNEGNGRLADISKYAFKKNRSLKKYVDPLEYLYKEHPKNLGRPLFKNTTQDEMVMGSRGSAKSYFVAIGEIEYRFVFYDAKSYSQYLTEKPRGLKSEQCIGAEDTDKSSELLDKFASSQDAKTDTANPDFVKWFGIWGQEGDDDFTPCPFYQKAEGSLKPANKKNPYRNSYLVKLNGQWKPRGSKSKVFHVNYSSKKGDGETAASGGRYNFSNVEEVGLAPKYTEIKAHNEETVKRGGERFGVNWSQGTSGNIEYVQSAKKIMLNPRSYQTLAHKNQFGTEGKNREIARFVPAYVTRFKYKDKNGNTDFKAAIDRENQERAKRAKSDDPTVLQKYLMNRPCYVHEMWLSDRGYYFPYAELQERAKELQENNLFETIGTPITFKRMPNGSVDYDINYKAKPIVTWPLPKDLQDPSGCVRIFEWPEENAPSDMYHVMAHDPYVEEDINFGGSQGVTYLLKNPKYIPQGYSGNIIVAEYIGKPIKGLEYYYEQQEMLLEFYNCPPQSLWYEKNRGEYCRAYYMRKAKMHYLCLTPQRAQGSNLYQRQIQSTGFIVGAHGSTARLNLIKMTADWLKEETEFMEQGKSAKKMNLYRIPSLYLVNQLMEFNLKDNFDGVSALLGLVLGLREYEMIELESDSRKTETNPYKKLLNNTRLFQGKENTRKNTIFTAYVSNKSKLKI